MSLRRFPHLRPADPSDTDPLVLLCSLPPGEAREAERMFQRQHKADRSFDRHQTVEAGLPPGGIERYVGARVSQAASTGGGRRRPTYPTQE